MKDYKRLTKSDWHNAKFDVAVNKEHRVVLHRLWELENRIESGELDYVADKDEEIARLTTQNADLRARLENAVELPCIEPMTTWDWDATTGLGKSNFGKYWKVLYRDKDGEFIAYMGATKAEAEAMLEELKGGKE